MATTKRPPPTSELDSGGWTFRARGFAHGPFEPSISGCLTGDLGVPGYEPDGISWLPHPATSAHRATARCAEVAGWGSQDIPSGSYPGTPRSPVRHPEIDGSKGP